MYSQADSTGERKKECIGREFRKKSTQTKAQSGKKVRKQDNECMSICDRVKRSKGCNYSPRGERDSRRSNILGYNSWEFPQTSLRHQAIDSRSNMDIKND